MLVDKKSVSRLSYKHNIEKAVSMLNIEIWNKEINIIAHRHY